jgi:hypothetical protein
MRLSRRKSAFLFLITSLCFVKSLGRFQALPLLKLYTLIPRVLEEMPPKGHRGNRGNARGNTQGNTQGNTRGRARGRGQIQIQLNLRRALSLLRGMHKTKLSPQILRLAPLLRVILIRTWITAARRSHQSLIID